jgi:hypothetical protein
LYEQLCAGYRFFDLRFSKPRLVSYYSIYHGPIAFEDQDTVGASATARRPALIMINHACKSAPLISMRDCAQPATSESTPPTRSTRTRWDRCAHQHGATARAL